MTLSQKISDNLDAALVKILTETPAQETEREGVWREREFARSMRLKVYESHRRSCCCEVCNEFRTP